MTLSDSLTNRVPFLRGIEEHVEIGSTNDRALELCTDPGLALPFLVLAERQTAGRGRGANRWWSGDGALLFSLIIEAAKYDLPEARWPQLSLGVAGAVCQMLEQFTSSDVGLKWPNDVWLNGRKVCGILVEVPPAPRGRLVIGLGLNVNNSYADAPAELQARLTSLRDESGRTCDLQDVLVQLLRQVHGDLQRLATCDPNLPELWRRCCVLTGRAVTLDVNGQEIAGCCLGLADDGGLRLLVGDTERRMYGGTVRDIRP